MADRLFDLDLLDDEDPFELKPPTCSSTHAWASTTSTTSGRPIFYPAQPPAHWLMAAEIDGTILVVPLAAARDGNPTRCRPIGCYQASKHLADQYRRDR